MLGNATQRLRCHRERLSRRGGVVASALHESVDVGADRGVLTGQKATSKCCSRSVRGVATARDDKFVHEARNGGRDGIAPTRRLLPLYAPIDIKRPRWVRLALDLQTAQSDLRFEFRALLPNYKGSVGLCAQSQRWNLNRRRECNRRNETGGPKKFFHDRALSDVGQKQPRLKQLIKREI